MFRACQSAGGSRDREDNLELRELPPHVRRYLAVALQVVMLDAVEDAFEPLNVLDAQPAAGF